MAVVEQNPINEKRSQWLLLPQYSIFSSEELSVMSPPVMERSPVPSVLLHPNDAAHLSVSDRDGVTIDSADRTIHMEVTLDQHCPLGAICVPVGLAQTAGLEYLKLVQVDKDPDWQPRLETTLIATDKAAADQEVPL